MTYIVIGDVSTNSGVVEAVVDLSGSSIPANGLFVAAEDTFTLGVADLVVNLNFENSDNVTHLLVTGFTGEDSAVLVTPKRVYVISDSRFDETIANECRWAVKVMRKGLIEPEIGKLCGRR